MINVTEQLVDRILLTEDLADEAAAAVLDAITVFVGRVIRARGHPVVRALLGTHRVGKDPSPSAGGRELFEPCAEAEALGAGAMIGDGSANPSGAPWAVLGAVLALASGGPPTSGRPLVRCVALGWEVQARMAQALDVGTFAEGWNREAIGGTIGAALGAMLAAGAGREAISDGLGIAASSVVGLGVEVDPSVRAIQCAKAAGNGVLAALLANGGFTGSPQVLEADRGLFRVLDPGIDVAQAGSILLDDFGHRWVLLDLPLYCQPIALSETLRRAVAAIGDDDGPRTLLAALGSRGTPGER